MELTFTFYTFPPYPMTQHTPAPCISVSFNSCREEPAHEVCLEDSKGKLIGFLDATEANARLMAAALELLEACEAALHEEKTFLSQCAQAIAKAKGA